jgi:hypothetical protein
LTLRSPRPFRDYLSEYNSGRITLTELELKFFSCVAAVPHETELTQLCTDLPPDIKDHLATQLSDLAVTDYYRRWFAIGDIRNKDQIHQDALDRQTALKKWAPSLQSLLTNTSS